MSQRHAGASAGRAAAALAMAHDTQHCLLPPVPWSVVQARQPAPAPPQPVRRRRRQPPHGRSSSTDGSDDDSDRSYRRDDGDDDYGFDGRDDEEEDGPQEQRVLPLKHIAARTAVLEVPGAGSSGGCGRVPAAVLDLLHLHMFLESRVLCVDASAASARAGMRCMNLWRAGDGALVAAGMLPPATCAAALSWRRIVLGLGSGDVLVLRVAHDALCQHAVLRGHTSAVTCLLAWPERDEVLAGAIDGSLRLWTVRSTALPPAVLPGHAAAVRCLAPLPGLLFASGGDDGCVRVWRTLSDAPVCVLQPDASVGAVPVVALAAVLPPSPAAPSADEPTPLAAVLGDGRIHVYQVMAAAPGTAVRATGVVRRRLHRRRIALRTSSQDAEAAVARVSPDQRLLAVAQGRIVSVWRTADALAADSPVCQVATRYPITDVLVLPTNRLVFALAKRDALGNEVRVLDLGTGNIEMLRRGAAAPLLLLPLQRVASSVSRAASVASRRSRTARRRSSSRRSTITSATRSSRSSSMASV